MNDSTIIAAIGITFVLVAAAIILVRTAPISNWLCSIRGHDLYTPFFKRNAKGRFTKKRAAGCKRCGQIVDVD